MNSNPAGSAGVPLTGSSPAGGRRRAMLFGNAVLAKELRTRMRGWRAAAVITVYLLVLSLIATAALLASTSSSSFTISNAASTGMSLFALLSLFQMLLILFITPASTSAAISGERQRQTLDLLLVTRLSTPSIVLGKLCAALSFDVLLLLCALPLFSTVFLFGGVAPEQLAAAYALFLATVVLLGSASLAISTLVRRPGASAALSNVTAFGLTVGLAVVTLFVVATRGASAPPTGAAGTVGPPLPWPAYIDPLFGLAYLMPDQIANGFAGSVGVLAGGILGIHLELWQYNVVADLLLAALCVAVSMVALRRRA